MLEEKGEDGFIHQIHINPNAIAIGIRKMNIEIVRTANGYLVRPVPLDHRGDYKHYDIRREVYVFESYAKLVDKLQEILDTKEAEK